MTDSSLLTKYRPTCFEEVAGHDSIVKSLFNALKKRSSHAFLLSGQSGLGKTTLARLGAEQLKCSDFDRQEIDAATKTGIDDMREVMADLVYRPLAGEVKVVIVDECHMLSKNAFTAMLKTMEHPPEFVYWFLCTTDLAKVPAAIKTRCLAYELKSVPTKKLIELLCFVNEEEKFFSADEALCGEIIALCAKEAKGSPRQALANLGACSVVKTVEEAGELLASAQESKAAIDLARALYKGADWEDLVKIIGQLNGENPESVRHVVRAYGTSILLKGRRDESTLAVLEAFSTPFYSSEGVTPLLLACGRLTQGDE